MLLHPLLFDSDEQAKQSAMIATAMVLQQQSKSLPLVKEFYAFLGDQVVRTQSEMIVFGVCLSIGILHVGGQNVVISFANHNSPAAIIGLALFSNFTYWHPFTLLLSLSFRPTTIIGFDQELQLPDFKMICNAKPCFFRYNTFKQIVKTKKLPPPVALSYFSQNFQDPFFFDEEDESDSTEEEMTEEADSFVVSNQERVTPSQLPLISLSSDNLYAPIEEDIHIGFVMLKKIV